jgi:type IV secretion system protein VirB8
MDTLTNNDMTLMSTTATDPKDVGSVRVSALREEAKWYLSQALEFEKSKQASDAKLTSVAWRVAIGAGLIAVVSIVCAAALVQLKRPNPPVILHDNTVSGKVDVLDVVRDGTVPFGEVEDRADLTTYVTLRESYDWYTIQDMFDTVKLMSADKERDQYVALYSLPNAPQKVLKDQFRVIATVGPITFIGKTAQVLFSKKLISLSGNMEPKTEYWVATISYRHDNLPEKKSELVRDRTGFRVTSYSVDRDWTRAADTDTAQTSPQVATAPSAAPQGATLGGR